MCYDLDMKNRLHFNHPAPDIELSDASGQPVQLSDLWKQATLLLAFTRHFGCPQCKEMLDRLTGFQRDLEAKRIRIAAVTQALPEEARAFCEQYAPGLLCLSDRERKAYKAYGLGRGGLSQTLFNLKVLRANRQIYARKGWKSQLPPKGHDAFLMSGVFIIGTDGLIRLPYYYDDIADHPSVDLLLHGISGIDWSQRFERPITPHEVLKHAK